MAADKPNPIVVVQWPTFGPYHEARLGALWEAGVRRGIDVLGLETSSRDATYGFVRQSEISAPIRTVFPNAVFDDLAPKTMTHGVMDALAEIDPAAICITSYSYPDARACLAWCKRHGRIAILMTDSIEGSAKRVRWREAVKRCLVGRFDSALVAGRLQREYLIQLGFPQEAIFDGYDVVDNDYFARSARTARAEPDEFRGLPGLEPSTRYFLAVGRMTETKNYHGLIEAYRRYREHVDAPWRLVVVGDGPERNRLEHQIAAQSIDGITMAGRRSYEELPAYYGLAGALVHAARADTWGLVVNEAMASGLPILCSKETGCSPDLVIAGRNGFVFDADDVGALSALMHKVSSDEEMAAVMGEQSYRIIQEWPLERFVTSLFLAYDFARGHPRRRATIALRAVLRLLFWTTRSPTSFHTVKP